MVRGVCTCAPLCGHSGAPTHAPPLAVVPRTGPPHCLYRATDGKRRKYSTIVSAGDAARFHPLCMSVIKGSTSSLKKIEKKKAAPAAKKQAS